jgi:hypothetical protein
MNDRKLSIPLAEAVCLNCGGPLPESRAKTRRYCSASCRTTAYNLRVSERLVPTRDAGDSLLPQWVRAPTGDVPLLTSAKGSLKQVAATLDGLARRIEAEESALRRDLDRVRARLAKEQALERELAQTRQQVRERDTELRQLRKVLAERNAQLAVVTPPAPAPKTLTIFSAASVPDDFQPGISLLVKQADVVRRFARAQGQRGAGSILTSFADGLDFIHGRLVTAGKSLRQVHPDPNVPLSPATLRSLLFQALLPAFDDLYRCVHALRWTPRSAWLDSLRDVTDWMFACFIGVLERCGLSTSYPVGKPFDPHQHEASAAVEDATLPLGSIFEVLQVGFCLENKILRAARVVVVAARSASSSS